MESGRTGKRFDPPLLRHGGGTTVSFADGHVDYWKWKHSKTIKLAEYAEQDQYWNPPVNIASEINSLRMSGKPIQTLAYLGHNQI